MAPILKDYPRASFDKIEFPFTSRSATLEARTHTHEYPKQAGGFVEKLGRKLWEFTFEVPFHTTFENFPNLYPGRLDALTLTSSEGVAHLTALPGAAELRPVPVFVPHPRIAAAARDAGFSTVIATGAGDQGLIDGLIDHFSARNHNAYPG